MAVDAIFRTFDGRSVDPFKDVAATLPRTGESIRLLLELAREPDERLRHGATWVLKAWILDGVTLDARSTSALIRCIGDPAMPPMSVVNLQQALPAMRFTAAQARKLHDILLEQTSHEVSFLRGWAYNGLDVVACVRPDYRAEVDRLLAQAAKDPAASVRARVRNRVKERAKEQRRQLE